MFGNVGRIVHAPVERIVDGQGGVNIRVLMGLKQGKNLSFDFLGTCEPKTMIFSKIDAGGLKAD